MTHPGFSEQVRRMGKRARRFVYTGPTEEAVTTNYLCGVDLRRAQEEHPTPLSGR